MNPAECAIEESVPGLGAGFGRVLGAGLEGEMGMIRVGDGGPECRRWIGIWN